MDYLLNHALNFDQAEINQLVAEDIPQQVFNFHRTIPSYQASSLLHLSGLAKQLSIADIAVKDESQRFGLKAFKGLGASYAMAQIIGDRLGISRKERLFELLIKRKKDYQDLEFATTTDGNHGKAVAWAAQAFGCQSHIFMPKGSSSHRVNAIKQFTPNVTVTNRNYDDTVATVTDLARQKNWTLIQDTAWQGYQQIPDNIMRGYFTLITEIENQHPEYWPTHVFLQAGVGSLAAAIAAYFVASKRPTPRFLLVEPYNADCFYLSMQKNDGKAHRRDGSLETIMAGLACGMPSITAWQILKNVTHAFVRCDDQLTKQGILRYANPIAKDPAIISGESAAVTLGVLLEIMQNSRFSTLKSELNLDQSSRVLLLSTEGDTDPSVYQEILSNH